MKQFFIFFTFSLFSIAGFSGDPHTWSCEGYCFLGGDLPTNPFKPISSTGATEQEARDNLDCDPYNQNGVVCRQIESEKLPN